MGFWITTYSKETGWLVDKVPLTGIPLSKLQTLFGEPPNEPMVYRYPIDQEKAKFFSRFFRICFNFEEYNYCLQNIADE